MKCESSNFNQLIAIISSFRKDVERENDDETVNSNL